MEDYYESKIKEYVNYLFENMPETPSKEIFKEELLVDLMQKYHELLQNNVNDKKAYNKVISSIKKPRYIGDDQHLHVQNESFDKKKNAIITAIAVMMYILCPVSVICLCNLGNGILGVIIMFILIACATGLLIYNDMTKPKYMKHDDFLDVDFKDWDGYNHKKIRVRKSIESAMWAIIVVIYLIISFTTMAWHITWIIFVVGAAIEKVIRAYFEYKEISNHEL